MRRGCPGVPFRDTHHLSGAAVKMAEERGCSLFDLMPEDLRGIHPLFADDVAEARAPFSASYFLNELKVTEDCMRLLAHVSWMPRVSCGSLSREQDLQAAVLA